MLEVARMVATWWIMAYCVRAVYSSVNCSDAQYELKPLYRCFFV